MIGSSLVFTVKYARSQRLFHFLLFALTIALSNSIKAQEKTSDQFMEAVAARFYSWDLDHNQTLSVQELDIAIKDHANKGRSAAALAALKRASLATNYTLPTLTFNNIRWLVNRPSSKGLPYLVRLYVDSLRRINSLTNDQLFASALPRLETIRQGHIGDCFCLAPIGAMVHRDPQEVASMFSSAGGYHCVVRIGGEAIMVPLPTDAERGMGRMAGNSHDGLWVDIYEEAMGQLQNSRKTLDQETDPIESIANGGGAGKIISDLTGHSVSGFSLDFGKNPTALPQATDLKMTALRWKLSDAMAKKRIITCSTLKPTTPALNPRHVYAVLSYNTSDDSLTLWNPHGNEFKPTGPPSVANGYPTHNGQFTIPLSEFVQQFTGMAFEGELASRQ